MKKIYCLLFTFVFIISKGQNLGYSWYNCMYSGMGSNTSTYHLYDDHKGNIYSGTLVFQSNFEYYIKKNDLASGNQFFIFKAVENFGNYQVNAEKIRTDNNNNIYLFGTLNGTNPSQIDFDPSFSSYTLAINGTSNFIAKYSPTGTILYAFLTDAHINDLAFDTQNNIYAAGTFSGTVDCDWTGSTSNLSSAGNTDIFIAKYSPAGNLIRARKIGSPDYEDCINIVNEGSDKFVIAGTFSNTTVDFDPGPSTFNVSSNGAGDVYVARLDSTFKLNWAHNIGGSGAEYLSSMSFEKSKIQLIAELASVSIDVDITPSVFNLSAPGTGLISYDTSRVLNFAYKVDFSSFSSSAGINQKQLSSNGNLAVVGNISNNFDADPGPGVATLTITAPGTIDWWFGVYNASGYRIAYSFGKLAGTFNWGMCVTINANDEVVVGGNVCGPQMDYDPGPGLATFCNSGSGIFYGSFIAKYGYCTGAPTGTVSAIAGPTLACANTSFVFQTYSITPVAGASGYNWTSASTFTGGATMNTYDIYFYGASGTIQVQPYNACGTSTTIQTLSITVNPQPTVSAISSNTLICVGQTSTLTANGALTYSWSTSATGSATAVSPTVNTTYTVTGTDVNGCKNTDTITQYVSTCIGINENNLSGFGIYPNPNNGEINILLNNLNKNTSLEIHNTLGQLIKYQPIENLQTKIDLSKENNGVYFVKLVENGNTVYYSKIIKQ